MQRPPKDPDSVSRTFLKQFVLVPLFSLIIARNTSGTNNTRTNTSWPVKVPLKHKSQHGQWKCTPGNGNVTHIRQQIRPPQSAALVISWWGTGSPWRQPCNSNRQCKTVLSQTLQLCTLSQFSAQFPWLLFSALQLCSQYLVLKYPLARAVSLKTLASRASLIVCWCDVDVCEVHNFWCQTFTTPTSVHIACVPVISI